MPREAGLFESAGGSVVEGYLLLKAGHANIPPMWIKRARASRTQSQKEVARVLKKGRPADIMTLRDWELKYRKECFYHGLRALLELERHGRTRF
jgi:DNA-binding transcriptional regulator YiaG